MDQIINLENEELQRDRQTMIDKSMKSDAMASFFGMTKAEI